MNRAVSWSLGWIWPTVSRGRDMEPEVACVEVMLWSGHGRKLFYFL